MKSSFYFLCALSLLIFWSCQPTENPSNRTKLEPVSVLQDSSAIQYLLFCKEGIIEIWTDSSQEKPRLLESLQVKEAIDFPIGSYALQKLDQSWSIQYPNAFYKDKLGKKALKKELFIQKWQKNHPVLQKYLALSKENKVLVFPNDIRKDQRWEACFACPHWMAELYGVLSIEMERFSKS